MSTATNIWQTTVPADKGTFTPCPAGNHPGRIAAIVDIGHQPVERTEKDGTRYVADTRQIVLVFELAKKKPEGDPHVMGVRYTWSMNEKANFYKFVKSVTGRDYANGETFDTMDLLGKPVMVSVALSAPNANGKQFSNVTSIGSFPEGFPEPKWEHEPFAWSVLEKTGFPDRAWLPWIYGKTIGDLAAGSCESRGVAPLTRSNAVPPGQVGNSGHTFHAPTHAQSTGDTPGKSYPPEVDALRVKYGLSVGYGSDELQAKLDDIPARDYRVLDGEAVPF